MRRLIAFSLLLIPALPALAGGRTVALSTAVNKGELKLRARETTITVRAPKNAKLSEQEGQMGDFETVSGTLNNAGTRRLYKLGAGKYYASPLDKFFTIEK
jgi:hypothetical protein